MTQMAVIQRYLRDDCLPLCAEGPVSSGDGFDWHGSFLFQATSLIAVTAAFQDNGMRCAVVKSFTIPPVAADREIEANA